MKSTYYNALTVINSLVGGDPLLSIQCNIAKEVWDWWNECPILICVEN